MHTTDSDAQNWFFTHARVAPGNDDLPLIYFPTTEIALPIKPGDSDEKEVPFQNDVGPLRVSHEHPP